MRLTSFQSTPFDQLLRLGICFLVCLELFVIHEAIALLLAEPIPSLFAGNNCWVSKLDELRLPSCEVLATDKITRARQGYRSFLSRDFSDAEPHYEHTSRVLAEHLQLPLEDNENAVASHLLRKRVGSMNFFDAEPYYVEAQILTELALIERALGKLEGARRNFALAAAIFRELKTPVAERSQCLQEYRALLNHLREGSGAALVEDELLAMARR